jgi:hypothetical protein
MSRKPFAASVCLLGLLACAALAQEPQILVLDDLEGDVAPRWHAADGSAAETLEGDDKIVKEGELSGRWDPSRGATHIVLVRPDFPRDWAAWGALEMWVHSANPTGAVFAVVVGADDPQTDGPDYYRCLIPVDWEGWRLLHLEPRSFCAGRTPLGWGQIDSLGFAIAGWNDVRYVPGTVLRFDRIVLTKPWREADRRLLFDPDTDWCAWWPLGYATDPAKSGRCACDWRPTPERAQAADCSVPRDWSGMAHFNGWLYAENLARSVLRITVPSGNPASDGPDAYEVSQTIDWSGWRLVSLPLASFRRAGEPLGWQAVQALTLSLELPKDRPEGPRLCIDRLWLSAEPETEQSWAQWLHREGGVASTRAPTIGTPGAPQTPVRDPEVDRLLKEALAAKRQGNLELAFTRYVAVLLRDAENVEAHWGLAWVLAAKGEKEAAAEHFRKVAELSKDPKRVKDAKEALGRLR